MKKVVGIILSCVLILAGCSVQNSPLQDSNTSGQNSSQKDENSMKDIQKLIDIPGYVTIDGVLACAEAWLKKEEGLTPFFDMEEDELSWLSTPFMNQYVKKKWVKRLNNGDVIIIISTRDLDDDKEQYEEYVMENVRDFADSLGARSSIEINSRYTRIVVAKGYLETIVDAILRGETGHWLEDDEANIIFPSPPGDSNTQDKPGGEETDL